MIRALERPRRFFAGWLVLSVVAHASAGYALHALAWFEPPPQEPLPIRVFLEKSEAPGAVSAAPPAAAPLPPAKPAERPKRRIAPPTPDRVALAPTPAAPAARDAIAPAEVPGVAATPADVASGAAGSGTPGGVAIASLGAGGKGAGTGTGLDPEEAIRAYIDLVRKRIDALKRYPSLARSRSVEGTVVALVHLAAAGGVESVEIVESPSGLLTEPTRRAILAAGPFPAPPGELRRIRVPIRYRLD